MRQRKVQDNTAGSARRWALAAALALLPAPLLAESGSWTGDKGTDMVLDLLILRPMGLLATGVGSVAFVVALPFTLPSGSAGEASCELVSKPFAYTFSRPLGEIDGDGSPCREGAKR